MKTKSLFHFPLPPRTPLALSLCFLLGLAQLHAAPDIIFSEDFDSYTGPATSLEDNADADPDSVQILVQDDAPQAPFEAETGVQLINWLETGTQSLLIRSGSEAQAHIQNPRSGSSYQLDFRINTSKGSGDRNFYLIVRAMGSDTNGEDFMAYRSDRAAGNAIFYYDGIAPDTGWTAVPATHPENAWQHHRFIFHMRTLTFDLYIDDMENPVVTGGDLSRSGAAVPSMIIIRHEGNSGDDGYFAIDDITLTVEDSTTLATTFTEGFENYPAAAPFSLEDADPLGPWITTEADGTADAKPHNHFKVQVVDTSMITPHSGSKALKLEGGQRAGVTFAWGTQPQADVQITWWARVPASVQGTVANYLRMSLYGAEGGRTLQGDSALLGYGSRDGNVGDATSLTIFTTGWLDTLVDYEPDTWEEYRLITHVDQGSYSIIKNPSSENPVTVADRAPFIGSATSWGPHWMVGFSSSNGSDHPPVYVDDIEILSLTTSVEPLPDPYEVSIEGDRFSNLTTLDINGPVGDPAIDPRDQATIFFTLDVANGGIYRASKVSPGTWEVAEEPIVSGLDRPSGLVVDNDGTLWWTHDFTMRLMRLKAPYESNSPEIIISNFGPAATDDDPIDLTIAPPSMVNYPGYIIIADRGTDGNSENTLFFVDPATAELDQTGYVNYLVPPSVFSVGAVNLNAIAPVPGSGEVAVINADAFIYLADGNGFTRSILPQIYADPFVDISPKAIAVDPTTGRIWLADDLFKEIWSIPSATATQDPEILELAFTLKEGSRPDSNIIFHDPGLEFALDGSILVVTDGSTANGGGRLHIFHNEEPQAQVTITATALDASGFTLQWSGADNASYQVQRAPSIGAAFEDISAAITEPQFTDPNPLATSAFYRVVVLP